MAKELKSFKKTESNHTGKLDPTRFAGSKDDIVPLSMVSSKNLTSKEQQKVNKKHDEEMASIHSEGFDEEDNADNERLDLSQFIIPTEGNETEEDD